MNVKNFLLRFFAAIGLVVPFLIGLIIWIAVSNNVLPKEELKPLPGKIVLKLDLTEPLIEKKQGSSLPFSPLVENGDPYFSFVAALRRAKDDPRVMGVVAHLGPYKPSFVHAQEIVAALDALRKNGKASYIFAASYGDFGPGAAAYYLASRFENIWLQPVGAVGLTGLGMMAPFAKTALKSWGIEGDFLRREEYKSVMDNIDQDAYSEPVRQNMQAMIESLAGQVAQGVAKGRGMDEQKVRTLMDQGPFTAKEAHAAGLVTRVGYDDEMLDEVKTKLGADVVFVDSMDYMAGIEREGTSKASKATVALIHAQGLIVDAKPKGPYSAVEDEVIDTDTLIKAFHAAAENKDVKAILFRVDSPGGSPSASESIRRALVLSKKAEKPVFVSMGEVAASGGYWISMEASRIIADPATITGSIGVMAGKVVVGGFLEKLGVNLDSLKTSDNAAMWSMDKPFSDAGRARMNAMVDETYGIFVEGVSVARRIPMEKMAEVAKGRVFTGQQALKLGLVDELGGMETAIDALKKELNLQKEDMISLMTLPPPESPQQMVLRVLREFMSNRAGLVLLMRQAVQIRSLMESFSGFLGAERGPSARLEGYTLAP